MNEELVASSLVLLLLYVDQWTHNEEGIRRLQTPSPMTNTTARIPTKLAEEEWEGRKIEE